MTEKKSSKKKIAVYANGCAYEYSGTTLEGIQAAADEAGVDLYMFLNFTSSAETEEDNSGELNIYRLPEMSDYDGIILISNQFNSPRVVEGFRKYIVDHKFCCISLEDQLDGLECVLTDNSVGTYQLATHLIEEHQVEEVVFVAGPDNLGESMARFLGAKKAFEEHGLEIPEDHIVHGNWSYLSGRNGAANWVKEHGHLPDAFMCANDYMAMGTCVGLNKLGYKVPGDTLVVGYDNLEESRTFSPGISSVNRNSWEVGYKGMKHLLALTNGEKTEPCEWVKTKMAIEESCGCFNTLKNSSLRNKAYNENFTGHMNTVDFTRRARVLEYDTSTIYTEEELCAIMEQFFLNDEYLQGCDVAIMLDNGFMSSVNDPAVELREVGYSTERDVLFCQRKEKLYRPGKLQGSEILPSVYLDDEKNHTYVFLPLHSREKNLGYVVFVDCLEKVKEDLLFSWMNSMYQVFSNVHKNMQFTNMNKRLFVASITDVQTGLLNRNGYNRRVIPYLMENHEKGEMGVIVLVDINRMKRINDVYGHQQGDLAVALIGECIRHVIPSEWIGVRYGGDEFLIAGKCEREKDVENILNRLEETLENKNAEMNLAFHLTVSYGYEIISPEGEFTLEEYVHKADEKMYVVKQKRHAQEGE